MIEAFTAWRYIDELPLSFGTFQDALYITTFVALLGALCFVVTSWYIDDDKKNVDDAIKSTNDFGEPVM